MLFPKFAGAVLQWLALSVFTHTLVDSLSTTRRISSPQLNSRSTANEGSKVFELTLTWEKYAPDGFERDMILVNGQFPGPTLEIDQGDEVEVVVHNQMPQNTTIHFHGIEQHLTPWSDGVPGLTQRQIQPGSSFTYAWTATQHGSYWYHAHERGQLDDGLYGALVIHPAAGEARPFGLISDDASTVRAMEAAAERPKQVVVSDLNHLTSERAWEIQLAAGFQTPCYDAVLFNGKGSAACLARDRLEALTSPRQRQAAAAVNATGLTAKGCLPKAVYRAQTAAGLATDEAAVPPGVFDECAPPSAGATTETVRADAGADWTALDLVGAAGMHTLMVSVDEHPMWVYAVDGRFVEPVQVHAVPVANGDRYSVLVDAARAGRFRVRAASIDLAQLQIGYAVYAVGNSSSSSDAAALPDSAPYIDEAGRNATADVVFFDGDTMGRPYPAAPPAQAADQTFRLTMRRAGYSYGWALNETAYPGELDDERPLLFEAPAPAPGDGRASGVTLSTRNGTWVDIVLESATFPAPPHPIHKHGSAMWKIGAGQGSFAYGTVAEALEQIPGSFNLVDPPRRDGFVAAGTAAGPTWMAVRYHVANPGAWLLHCHIEAHLLGGMSVAIQDGVDAWPKVPDEYLNYQ